MGAHVGLTITTIISVVELVKVDWAREVVKAGETRRGGRRGRGEDSRPRAGRRGARRGGQQRCCRRGCEVRCRFSLHRRREIEGKVNARSLALLSALIPSASCLGVAPCCVATNAPILHARSSATSGAIPSRSISRSVARNESASADGVHGIDPESGMLHPPRFLVNSAAPSPPRVTHSISQSSALNVANASSLSTTPSTSSPSHRAHLRELLVVELQEPASRACSRSSGSMNGFRG